MNREDKEIKVSSLKKAIMVLNCFTQSPKLGVTQISNILGLNKSNVYNILSTYEAMGYLEKEDETGKYQLGLGIFTLSRALGDSFSITKVAQPYMQELANLTNERVYLGIPHEDEVVYLEAFYPAEKMSLMRSLLGEKAKMYCTGIGKAMLAYLPEEKIIEYSNRPMKAYTENTITKPQKLQEELAWIRSKGYAIDHMEHEFGIKCIGVPIFDREGKIYAGVSVSGPSLRFTEERMEQLFELLQKYIKIIQERV